MAAPGRLKLSALACALCVCSFIPQARGETDRVAWMASRLLSGKDIRDYEMALTVFVRISDPRVLPTLLKLADSQQEIPRAEAAGVLWHYNTKGVREKLVEMTSDTSPAVRVEAAKSLCLMNYGAYVGVIVDAVRSDSHAVRIRALRALGDSGSTSARKSLEEIKGLTHATDKVWTAYAARKLGVEPDKQLRILQDILLDIPKAAWLPGAKDPSVKTLKRSAELGRKGLESRLQAAEALSRLGDDSALDLLVQATGDQAALRHSRGPMRWLTGHGSKAALACARGLGDARTLVRLGSASTVAKLKPGTGSPALAEALGKALDDRSSLVRRAVLRAISYQRLESERDRVLAALQHEDPLTRSAAAVTLGHVGSEGAVKALVKRLTIETHVAARRGIYKGLALLRSPSMVQPLFGQLKQLYRESRQNSEVRDEMELCILALGAGGEPTAERVLRLLDKASGEKRRLLLDVLAHTGCHSALLYFMDRLRETPPAPDGPTVRFFDSLDRSYVTKLESLIESESAMWTRLVLARALYRLGKTEYGRGILWGLKNEDPYLQRLSAALARGLQVPGSVEPLIALLEAEHRTAWLASASLLADGSPTAIAGFLEGLRSASLRQRPKLPLMAFWEGARSSQHPYAKEVDQDRVWVLFAEDRLGNHMDLFLTWSADGRTWHEPVFSGLTSFADPQGQVPPPTFSLKVRGRAITIALTRTFARSPNPSRPRFKTLQRVFKHKLQDFFADADGDGLTDFEEKHLGTNARRRDSDGDGLPDGKDKNPLAAPARSRRDEDLLKVLAFSYATMVEKTLPERLRRLVVLDSGKHSAPELPTFPWLVQHLSKAKADDLWQMTGGSYPRIAFGATEFESSQQRAMQPMSLFSSPTDRKEIEVTFTHRGGQWTVTGYREID
ncbi:MAG: HEAT repeat domain-containing protein [Deltaproteobacteria bacterium]|nr:HEAT repeat domain-containing protein [Deltaproteobacteria bacterium]